MKLHPLTPSKWNIKRLLRICLVVILISSAAGAAISVWSATTGSSFSSSADGVKVELGTDQIFQTGAMFPNSTAVYLHNTSFIGSNSTVIMGNEWNGTVTGWVNGTLFTVGSPASAGSLTIAPDNATLTKYTLAGNGNIQGFNFARTEGADGRQDFWYSSNGTSSITVGNLTNGVSYGAVDMASNAALDVAVADASGYAVFDAMPSRGSAHIRIEQVGTLYIRNQTPPWGLITTPSTATILFYENIDSDQLTVVNKTVSGGTIDLTDLPLTASFIIQTSDIYGADGTQTHWANVALLPDISTQSAIYVLPTFEADGTVSNDVTWQVLDSTGLFGADDHPRELTVQRAINVTSFSPPTNPSGFLWQTVSGTQVGSSNIFNTTLEHNTRYRVKIKSPEGERSLGSFIPTVDNSLITLDIKNVNFTATQVGAGYYWNASVTENPSFRFYINNSAGNAYNLLWNVSYQHNNSLIYESTGNCQPTGCGVFQESVALNSSAANHTLIMRWSAVRPSGKYLGAEAVYTRLGALVPVPLSSNVSQNWLGFAGVAILTILAAGAGGYISAGFSALIISLFAGILWALKILIFPGLTMAASGGIIFLALLMSVFYLLSGTGET